MRIPERTLDTQTGGITILVALMLLVLLTISAVAMSRNSLREVIISGTVRQGAEARNVADNGLEWSCYWLTPDTTGITKATPDAAATALLTPVKLLSGVLEMSGVSQPVSATGIMTRSESDGASRSYSLSVIRMGKLTPEQTGTTSITTGSFERGLPPEVLPDIWSVRSTGKLDYGLTGVTFQHIREAWVVAPPQGQ
jgi:Tfp pilus assembly protein PilX